MQGSLDQPPIVLVARRRRAMLVFGLFTLMFIVTALTPQTAGLSHISGLMVFGLFALLGLIMLVAPVRLEIGPSGFCQNAFGRTRSYLWTDVANFRPAVLGLNNKGVTFDSATTGKPVVIQSNYEITPQPLAALLNQWRAQWLGSTGITHIMPPVPAQSGFMAALTAVRFNRKAFWIATVIIFAAAILLSRIPGAGRGVSSVVELMWIRVYSARLHDIGRSGWWQLVLYAIQLPTMILLIAVGHHAPALAFAVGLAIQLVFTTILGAIPGQSGDNRFGRSPL
jgi:uncharacterized membrane protein YhaH (DUF805 family)